METAFDWKPEYEELARLFLKQHFGGPHGLTNVFPCMRVEYPWGAQRPTVIDSRVPAKNNTEYHGLERHASQYHATAQYEFAYHHWLLAAYWRRGDAEANNFVDPRHEKAVQYCIKQALYNRALYEWQCHPRSSMLPMPEEFEINGTDVDDKEERALREIDEFVSNFKKT